MHATFPNADYIVDKVPYKRSPKNQTSYHPKQTYQLSILTLLYIFSRLFHLALFKSSFIEKYMMMTMDQPQEPRQLYQDSCKEQMMIFSRNQSYDSDKSSSIGEASTNTNGSSLSSSLDTTDDASSSFSSNSSGSLYDLSDLMSQLPIKRGLSKFYEGKSQSFTSLARVGSIEELVKKESAFNKRKSMKGCKSYGGSLNNFKLHTLPKPIISKKNSRGSLPSSSFPNRKGSKFCQ